jgi:cell division protein ZapA
MKQVEVTILGQGYILGCPDGGETLLDAAVRMVDQEMSAIRDGGKVKARERIAVLAALNLAYRLAEMPAAIESGPEGEAAAMTDGQARAKIDALVRSLDQVLREDGQLI